MKSYKEAIESVSDEEFERIMSSEFYKDRYNDYLESGGETPTSAGKVEKRRAHQFAFTGAYNQLVNDQGVYENNKTKINMKKKKFVSESLNELYGKGYTSTSTARPFDDKTVPKTREEQYYRTRDWERRYGKDTPADMGARAARKEEAPERKDPDSPFYTPKGEYSMKRARPGYKQYHVLKALSEAPDGLRYTDIIKIAYELSHGEGTFDPKRDRGYWSGTFNPFSHFAKGFGSHNYPWQKHYNKDIWIQKYTYKEDGKYFINEFGRKKLEELEKKWG